MNLNRVMMITGILASVLLPGGTTQTTATPTLPDQFQVLTHNVYTVLGAPGSAQRIDFIIDNDYIYGHDVIILTEMFNDALSDRLLEALSTEYPYQTPVLGRDPTTVPDCAANTCWNSMTGTVQPNQFEDGGVVILSRWPIVTRHQSIFATDCGVDALARKGFVYVELDVNGTRVHVIGTHSQADPSLRTGLANNIEQLLTCNPPAMDLPELPCPTTWNTPQEAVRLGQFMEIDTWLKQQVIAPDDYVIIGGDLNVDKVGNPAEYDRMRCVLDLAEPAYTGTVELDPPWYTFDGQRNDLIEEQEGRAYIDYVLIHAAYAQPDHWTNRVLWPTSLPATWEQEDQSCYELSDHYPVVGFANRAQD